MKSPTLEISNHHLLLAYMADLELEVDRLRRHGNFLQYQVRDALKRIRMVYAKSDGSGGGQSAQLEIEATVRHLAEILEDLKELPSYHPAHDQVIAIAIRPLVEQVFRWQQRLENVPHAKLQLELQSDHVTWFPARLRHVLDTLFSNALKYRDPDKNETRVHLTLQASADSYIIAVADNGVGIPARDLSGLAGLLLRAAPTQASGLSVGLAVVKLLVEQSGGTLTAESNEGSGTTMTVTLPYYDVDDFLT
jgi:signal transduction histidine kinase